uniref:Lipocalin/cytosolic fatty-acid binding domain-containing protein n=1 Tax=Graphocephala atropunctata TaxID=36148 RepID=A0A1B6KA84_9HEMI
MRWYCGALVVILLAFLLSKLIIEVEEKKETSISISKNQREFLEPVLNKMYSFVEHDGNFQFVMISIGETDMRFFRGHRKEVKLLLTESDGVYTLHRIFPYDKETIAFRIGEEFEEETTHYQKKVKSVITQHKNNLTHTQFGDPIVVITRSFTSDCITVEYVVDKSIRSVLKYKPTVVK